MSYQSVIFIGGILKQILKSEKQTNDKINSFTKNIVLITFLNLLYIKFLLQYFKLRLKLYIIFSYIINDSICKNILYNTY